MSSTRDAGQYLLWGQGRVPDGVERVPLEQYRAGLERLDPEMDWEAEHVWLGRFTGSGQAARQIWVRSSDCLGVQALPEGTVPQEAVS